ncbi:MAG: photosynthetic reaction center cytochrome PufC [Sphingomonadaceae bacterium]|uniref:photosynthetic reaction center cytochrome PufC n=1 Tax=Thermaurantiacus sp. TaxID=2820283 RepID=UPI00298F19C2|nr:photosynthetic reaction center cytochrome PufC [Thermaurantiacus sp.]MCS6987813.1 photosynthetic reaction center cytochrome PufC [Sphingomonadaceae bacterium]MDW8414967.1 photosynthetic reaction center cytochrome PufC [Thermaurantiacus sp.]
MTRAPLTTALLAGLPLALAACEVGPKDIQQTGHRGTGMVQLADRSNLPGPDRIPGETYRDIVLDPNNLGEPAGEFYENVQVLGDLKTEEFNRLMIAITEWVSPEQGCNYCHNPENMASDEVYTKVVARKMIQMTRAINVNWKDHVKDTGVTCWTCHRGQPVPAHYWTTDPESMARMGMRSRRGQNNPDAMPAVYSSLPYDPFTAYILEKDPSERRIRVSGTSAYPMPGMRRATLMDTEMTYGFMMHFSDSLGVNCTFCHNTHSFSDWSGSTAQRAISWYGIRMVRDANENYITPLTSVFPASRLGPAGDPFKINCATCHQGKNKPMGGYSMIREFPELARLPVAAPAAVTPTTAAAPQPTDSAATAAVAVATPAG